jgi:hypothetical protein
MGEAVDKVEMSDNGWNLFIDLSKWLPWRKKSHIDQTDKKQMMDTGDGIMDEKLDVKVKQRTEELKNKLLIHRLKSYRMQAAEFVPSETDTNCDGSDENATDFAVLHTDEQRSEKNMAMKTENDSRTGRPDDAEGVRISKVEEGIEHEKEAGMTTTELVERVRRREPLRRKRNKEGGSNGLWEANSGFITRTRKKREFWNRRSQVGGKRDSKQSADNQLEAFHQARI